MRRRIARNESRPTITLPRFTKTISQQLVPTEVRSFGELERHGARRAHVHFGLQDRRCQHTPQKLLQTSSVRRNVWVRFMDALQDVPRCGERLKHSQVRAEDGVPPLGSATVASTLWPWPNPGGGPGDSPEERHMAPATGVFGRTLATGPCRAPAQGPCALSNVCREDEPGHARASCNVRSSSAGLARARQCKPEHGRDAAGGAKPERQRSGECFRDFAQNCGESTFWNIGGASDGARLTACAPRAC